VLFRSTGEVREAMLSLRRVHFSLDGYDLGPDSRDALTNASNALRNHPDVAVYVQGNADERGTTEYNLGLGERRARAVTSYLTRLGVDPAQLSIVSFGEERPLDTRHGAEAWATNRRVDFVLLRGNAQLVLEEGVRLTDRGTRVQ
jgi:peptidoglycan-associated lipoprotein